MSAGAEQRELGAEALEVVEAVEASLPGHAGGAPTAPEHDRATGTTVSTDGALSVLRRGIAAAPELREGIGVTIALALLGAAGRVVIPVLTQQVIDRGLTGPEGMRTGLVLALCAAGAATVITMVVVVRLTRV